MEPKYTITDKMLHDISKISKLIGTLEYKNSVDLTMRKRNRIQSIQSSLAIEANSLSIKQVTEIIEGERVIGPYVEIKEVQNAYSVYNRIEQYQMCDESKFLKVHEILTQDLITHNGRYRESDVGVSDENRNVIHLGARPQFIPNLMSNLFNWLKKSTTQEIIKSCIFHYELVYIHPFEDGNGRIARFWQSVILTNWNPMFAWVPIESIIYKYQEEYYNAIAISNDKGECTYFIEFMLEVILETLLGVAKQSEDESTYNLLTLAEQENYKVLLELFEKNNKITVKEFSMAIKKSLPTARRYLSMFASLDLISAHGENKNRYYMKGSK